jgi:hypothetical protein
MVDEARLLAVQFTLPALLAVGMAWLTQWKGLKVMNWGLMWMFVIFSLFYTGYSSRDAAVYLVAPWIVVSIWIGDGVARMWRFKLANFAFGAFTAGVILVCLMARIPLAWGLVDPARDTLTSQFIRNANNQLPIRALVFTSGDQDSFPLWYSHFGLGQRPDLHIIVRSLTNFGWYRDSLRKTYPDLVFPPESAGSSWSQLLTELNPARPNCQSKLSSILAQISITCNGSLLLKAGYFNNGN